MEQSYRPDKDVRDAVVVWSGTTTSAGDAGGTYLVDSGLTQGNNYWINMVVLIKSGNSNGQARRISVFAAGTLTVDTAFALQIVSGTKYDILGQHAAAAGGGGDATLANQLLILGDIGDASASTLGSLYAILGNPAQTYLAMVGYEGASSLAAKLTAARAGYLDNINNANLSTIANISTLNATNIGYLTNINNANLATIPAISSARVGYLDNINQAGLLQVTATRAGYLDNLATTAAGRVQIATTTIDLNQAAATYTLFTGTTQNVTVEYLIIQMPNIIAGGALTSISIQTNDATPQVFISSQQGAVANLTAEAQLSKEAPIKISTGKLIQLTIAGGAHGVAYSCSVTVLYRSIVAGGTLV